MKKMRIVALAAVLLASVGMAFAQTSFTKTSTAGLIEDGVIDSLNSDATGVVGSNTVIFGQYWPASEIITAGFGQRFLKNMWASVYYFGNISTGTNTTTDSALNLSYDDEDYVDTTLNQSKSDSDWKWNQIAFSYGYNGLIGGKFQFNGSFDVENVLVDPTDFTATVTNSSTDTQSTGNYTSTTYTDSKYVDHNDYYDLYLYGSWLKPTFGKVNFYVKPVYLGLNVNGIYKAGTKTSVETKDGSTLGLSQSVATGTRSSIVYTPSIQLEIGSDLPKFGITTSTWAMDYTYSMDLNDSAYGTNVTTTSTTTTADRTTVTTSVASSGTEDSFGMKHVVDPYLNTTYDLGDKIKLVTKLDIPVTFRTSSKTYLPSVTTTTADKTYTVAQDASTDVKTVNVVQTHSSDQNVSLLTLNVAPVVSTGMQFTVVPEKFFINCGAEATCPKYTLTKTTKTNSKDASYDKTTTTLTDGTSTTSYNEDPSYVNGTAETETTTQTWGSVSYALYAGASWSLTKNVSLDTVLVNGQSQISLWDTDDDDDYGILNNSLSLQLTIKF